MIAILLFILGIYLALGLVFSLAFVFSGGPKKIDPGAVEGTIGFRLLLLPGCTIFWPMLLRRWITGTPPPTETSAHRIDP